MNEALRLFSSVLKAISFDKLCEIVESLKGLRYFVGIVDLCLLYASYLDPADPQVQTAVPDQSYFRRMDCYQLIFTTLASLDSTCGTPVQVEKYKAIILNQALASDDSLFHYTLYDWFIQQNMSEELLKVQSPYLEGYLAGEPDNILKAELLWKLYAKHGRFVLSAQVLYHIAQLPGLAIDQRLEYLTKAVTHAKSSGSVDMGANQNFLTELQDTLDVARVQLDLSRTLVAMPEMQLVKEELDRELVDMDTLYHQYAARYQIYEIVLAVFHLSDLGASGRAKVEGAWLEVIQKSKLIANLAAMQAQEYHRTFSESIAEKIKELGKRFYPNENSFPLHFLISQLEHAEMEREGDHEWLIAALRDVKVPFNQLFQIYHEIFRSKVFLTLRRCLHGQRLGP